MLIQQLPTTLPRSAQVILTSHVLRKMLRNERQPERRPETVMVFPTPQEETPSSDTLSSPRRPTTQTSKKTYNRDQIDFGKDSIMKKEDIDNYEMMAKREDDTKKRARTFLTLIYNDTKYKNMWTTRVLKRGANAKNWRHNGTKVWLCPSLHYVNPVYENLGKAHWTKNGAHGWQRPNSPIQCRAVTKKGSRCVRSISMNLGGCYCTEHHKVLN